MSKLQISYSRHFGAWLAEQQMSLALTTYQGNKLLLIGLKPDGRLGIFERTFMRCMGLWSNGQTIWLSSRNQLWRFENVLTAGPNREGFDRLYVPRHGYVTGDLDIHDVSVAASGQVLFVNTLFSCLATLDERMNFRPVWRPPFITRLAPEDRCHLNGLAMAEGEPRYVTAAGRSDLADGWRERRRTGGCLIDVASDEIVGEGLCMPHSPRLHDGRLWLLEAGNGQLGYFDLAQGRFERVAFCPGFLRGLTLVGNFAVVGSSRPRHEPTFTGLPLEEELSKRGGEARAGIHIVDLERGDIVHWLRIDGLQELYDVVALPSVRRPKALGFMTDEISHSIWFEDQPGQPQAWMAAPANISH
ncbi:MAG: TIGR03032 family protein [Gemmataceae bacterium]